MKLAENIWLCARVPVTPGAQLPPDGRPRCAPSARWDVACSGCRGRTWRAAGVRWFPAAAVPGLPTDGRRARRIGGTGRRPTPPAGAAAFRSAGPPDTPENRAVALVRSPRGPCTTQPALPYRTASGMLPPTSRVLLRGSGQLRSDAVPLGVWGWEDDSRTEPHHQLTHLSKPLPPHEDSLRRDTDGRSRNP